MAPILRPNSLEIISKSVGQTRRVGIRLGRLLNPGDVVALVGDLGSGKTTLVQGIATGWGSYDQVSSPTFVLVNVYRRSDGKNLYHLDAYRIGSSAEAVDLDLDTMLDSGPLLVEWAEKILDVLPDEHLRIDMQWVAEFQRDMMLTAEGERYQNMLNRLARDLYGVR